MKKYGWFILLIFPVLSFGQIRVAVQAGANYVTPHLSKPILFNSTQGGAGWQAGIHAGYQVHKLLLYSGANITQYHFSESEGDLKYNRYTYHPVYLQIPIGIGYKLPLYKTKSLTLYGGIQELVGIGGKLQQPYVIECFTAPCPQLTNRVTSNIRFGKSPDYYSYESFARTATNLQAGATVTLTNSLAAGVSYAWSITNAGLTDSYSGTTHLRVWDVSVKYYLIH